MWRSCFLALFSVQYTPCSVEVALRHPSARPLEPFALLLLPRAPGISRIASLFEQSPRDVATPISIRGFSQFPFNSFTLGQLAVPRFDAATAVCI